MLFGLVVMVLSLIVTRQRHQQPTYETPALGIFGTGFGGHFEPKKGAVAATPVPAVLQSEDVPADPRASAEPITWAEAESVVSPAPPTSDVPEVEAESGSATPSASPEMPFTVGPRRVKVEVLGSVRVTVSGREVNFARAEGRDLFALLAMSKDGELSQSVIDKLWPDEGERGARRLESAIRVVNAAMRHATGLAAEVRFVVKAGPRRRLSAAYFDVDWWRFEDAYRQASSATDDGARRDALRLMVGLYQGPLLDDRDDLWCVPSRQAAMRQAVNAAARLAELERKVDADRALDVLSHAVERIDRHSELLWCQLMTVQGELGRLPALRSSFEQFTERLAEIDAKPSVQARQIYQRFIS